MSLFGKQPQLLSAACAFDQLDTRFSLAALGLEPKRSPASLTYVLANLLFNPLEFSFYIA